MSPKEPSRSNEKKRKKSSDKNVVEKKRTQHPVMWAFSVIILIIVVVAFVIAPAMGGQARGDRLVFGYYDGEAIEYKPDSYFSRQRDAYAEQVAQSQEQTPENAQWLALQVWKSAYDATVIHTAILQQARRSGLHISEKKLDRSIAQYGPYRENGQFSAELYRRASNAEKMATRELFRENLIHDQWIQDLFSIHSSPLEQDFFISLSTPERRFEYVSFSLDDYPKDELIDFAQERSDLFRRASFSRIALRGDRGEAESIYSQLQENPGRFEELAQNYSTDEFAERGGDMGWQYFFELAASLEDSETSEQLFSLSQNEISPLIETSYGWAIYRCDQAAEDMDFDQKKSLAVLRDYMINNQRGTVEDYFIQEAEEFRKTVTEDDFREVARQRNLDYSLTNYFPINYNNSFFLQSIENEEGDGNLSSAQSSDRVLRQLFSLEEGQSTEALVLGRSVIVAKLIDEREAPEQRLNQARNYYSYIRQSIRNQEMRTHFLNSDKLEDNFMPVFSRYFLN